MGRMRFWLALGILSVSGGALAQSHGGGGGGGGVVRGTANTRGPMIFRFEKSRNEAAAAARAKAAAGDCKTALDLFDEALRHSIDPLLYRDRGLCHEKLGDVYPAIDDYREYLAQMPDAPDAQKYRERLEDLVKDASQDISMSKVGGGGTFEAEMAGGLTNGETPSKTTSEPVKDETGPTKPEDTNRPLSQIEHDEARDVESSKSPLRLGKGFIVGAYLYPRYVINSYNFGFGQGLGVHLGYSLSAASTLLLEVGWVDQLESGTASSISGLTTAFGYEARIPFDTWADNQLLLGALGGYENMGGGTLGVAYSSFTVRGQVGYRHVFGPSFSLDLTAQGGLMGTFPLNNTDPTTPSFEAGAFVGGYLAVNVGF